MDEVGKVLMETNVDEGNVSDSDLDTVSSMLKKLDDSMRAEVDYIFDAPVSATLCKDGSMYDPIDGMFRYERIIDKIADLYNNNLSREFSKMRQRVDQRTNKYTKQYHK
jgi:hypothetical protein